MSWKPFPSLRSTSTSIVSCGTSVVVETPARVRSVTEEMAGVSAGVMVTVE